MRRARVLLLAVVACNDPVAQPDPVPFAVVQSDIWAGTELIVTSPGFAPRLPSVLIDDDTVTARVVDDTTLAVLTPTQPGTHQLRVISPYIVSVPAIIQLRGFLGFEEGPQLRGPLRVLPGAPAVYGDWTTGVVRWDIRARQATTISTPFHDGRCVRSLGGSFEPGRVVINRGDCFSSSALEAWRLEATPVRLDSFPPGVNDLGEVQLAPHTWFHRTHSEFYLVVCDTLCVWQMIVGTEQNLDVEFSPGGDLAIPIGTAFSPAGVTVLDAPGARVGYRLPELHQADAAAFTEEGDTMFVSGVVYENVPFPARLLRVLARTGEVDTVVTLHPYAVALAVDPTHPWLYVLMDRPPSLEVWDRRTLARVASLPLAAGGCVACFSLPRVLVDPLQQRVYVVDAGLGPLPTPPTPYFKGSLFVFDTPP